jgi:HEAT repeat protein
MKTLVAVCLVACAAPSAAQPLIRNAKLTDRAVTGNLETTVRALVGQAGEPAWIAWETPSVPRRNDGDDWCWSEGAVAPSNRLEPSNTLFVFLRAENRELERVRMFDDRCAIDAGNRQVTWLKGVKPAESVALLATLAASTTPHSRVWKGALAALAQHAGREAVAPLVRLARNESSGRVRGEALFWLAQRAGNEATAAISDAIANDPDTQVKKRAVFALSQLPADEGVPKLIDVARTNRNPVVRKQAMFWLGQSKDARALAFFEEILK